MREGWRVSNLGTVADRVIGRTPPIKDDRYWAAETGERPFCSIADMGTREIVPSRRGVTELAEVEGKAKRVPAGSLLLSFKLTLGKIGFASTDLFPNEAIAWLEPRAMISKQFLALALESIEWDSIGSRAVKGRTLNSDSLDALPISYPSALVQRRIVDLMGALDEAIEAAKSASASLSVVRDEALTKSFKSGDLTALSDFASPLVGFAFKSADYSTDGTRLLRGDNIVPGGIRWDDAKRLSGGAFEPKMNAYYLDDGDVVIAMDRPVISTGVKVSRMSAVDIPALLVQRVTRLRPAIASHSRAIELCLNSREFKTYLETSQVGSHVPHITGKQINDFRVPRDLFESSAIELIGSADEAMQAAREQAKVFQVLRFNLLAACLSGEHEIPSSYDEVMEVMA
jgi:type I restriction enzyme S subunit